LVLVALKVVKIHILEVVTEGHQPFQPLLQLAVAVADGMTQTQAD
jgi:hypothetical protein